MFWFSTLSYIDFTDMFFCAHLLCSCETKILCTVQFAFCRDFMALAPFPFVQSDFTEKM